MTISLAHKPMLIVLSSPSGGGKSSIVNALMGEIPGLAYSVSVTSRPPRKGEVDGRAYHFVSEKEFEQLIVKNEFYEWARVHQNYYGTRKSLIDAQLAAGDDVVLDVDVKGGLNLKRQRPESVLIFVLPPSMEELRRRLELRGLDTPPVIDLRIQNAVGEIQEIKNYDYVLINRDLKETIREVERIVQAERLRSCRRKLIVENEPLLADFVSASEGEP